MNDTATTAGARAHARSQAGAATRCAPVVPATSAQGLPPGVAPEGMLWREVLGPGAYGVRRLPRGALVRLHDPLGDACAHVLVHNAWRPTERLNVADTVKVQWQAYLGAGAVLLSDMGCALMSISEDSSGAHDALCGGSNARANTAKYGSGGVHGPHPNARDQFAVALAKYGLDRRDIAPCVSFFKGVRVEPDGALVLAGSRGPGTHVVLRAEVPVIFSVVNVPHVLDPRPGYEVSELGITAWRDRPTTRADASWSATPERERAFLATEALAAEYETRHETEAPQ